jgi:hypothetical protein
MSHCGFGFRVEATYQFCYSSTNKPFGLFENSAAANQTFLVADGEDFSTTELL